MVSLFLNKMMMFDDENCNHLDVLLSDACFEGKIIYHMYRMFNITCFAGENYHKK